MINAHSHTLDSLLGQVGMQFFVVMKFSWLEGTHTNFLKTKISMYTIVSFQRRNGATFCILTSDHGGYWIIMSEKSTYQITKHLQYQNCNLGMVEMAAFNMQ